MKNHPKSNNHEHQSQNRLRWLFFPRFFLLFTLLAAISSQLSIDPDSRDPWKMNPETLVSSTASSARIEELSKRPRSPRFDSFQKRFFGEESIFKLTHPSDSTFLLVMIGDVWINPFFQRHFGAFSDDLFRSSPFLSYYTRPEFLRLVTDMAPLSLSHSHTSGQVTRTYALSVPLNYDITTLPYIS